VVSNPLLAVEGVSLGKTGSVPALRNLFLFLILFTICLTNMLCAQTQQNGISATEGAAITGRVAGTDYLWADSTALRWMLSLNGNSPLPLMAWPCTSTSLSAGIVYSGTIPSGSNVPSETCLYFPVPAVAGVPLLVGSSAPQWGATYLDLQANPLVTEIQNNSAGTTLNKLAILVTSGTSSQVRTALTSTTEGVEGICVAGCGSSNNAQIARQGIASCVFDSTGTTAGDYVQVSTTAGDCRDTGSASFPSNGQQVLGRVLSTHAGGGTYSMLLFGGGITQPAPSATVGQTGVWAHAGTSTGFAAGISSTGVTGTAGTVYFVQMNLSSPQVIGHFTADVFTTTTGTSTLYTCLYNSTASSLLWSASTAISNGFSGAVTGSSTQYTAAAGTYIVAWLQPSTATEAILHGFNQSAPMTNILNKNGTGRIGTAGTGQTSCPSSLTLTAGNPQPVFILLEP